MSIKESLVRRYVEQGGSDLTTMHSTSQLVKEVRDDEGDVPSGGTTGQVLTKTSDLPHAYNWDDASGGGSGAMIITPTFDYSNKVNWQLTYYYLRNVNYEFYEVYNAFLEGTPIFLRLPLDNSTQPSYVMLPLFNVEVKNNTPYALNFKAESADISEMPTPFDTAYVTKAMSTYTATYSNQYGLRQAIGYSNALYSVDDRSSVYQLFVDGNAGWQESPSGTLTIELMNAGGQICRPFDYDSKIVFGNYATQEYNQFAYANVETNCEIYTCVSVKYVENYNKEESRVEDRDITATFRTLAMSGNTPMIKTLTVYASENEIVIQGIFQNVQVTYSETILETGK